VDGEQPLTGLENLLRRFRSLPSGQLFLLGLPERVSVFRAPYAALFAWPRTIITPAEDYADFLDAIATGHGVPLLAQAPPFDREGRVDLGGGFARLTEVDRPRLVQVLSRRRAVGESGSDGFVFPLGRSRTKLVVLALQRVVVEIRLDIEPAAGADTSVVRCRIVQGSAGGVTFRRAVGRVPTRDLDVIRGSATLVRFEAERGLNAVVLNAVDRPQRLKGVFLRAVLPQDGTAP
jgi:hypothetical protein